MSDESMDMASRLFGGTSPPVVDKPASIESVMVDEQPLADRLYTSDEMTFAVPDEVKALREVPERRLFDNTADSNITSLVAEGENGAVYTHEQREAIGAEATKIAADIGLDTSDVNSMAAAARQIAATYTPESFSAMEADARAALQEAYGDQAGIALAAAQKLVARDGRVKALLLRTGLGSERSTVLRIAKLAMGR